MAWARGWKSARETPLADASRYQTVFARYDGSAAAPTAGLHFTGQMLIDLKRRGIQIAYCTLHIGLDTFAPVREEHIEDHKIHTERAVLTPEDAQTINNAKLGGGRIVAIGTTAVRTLETAAIRSTAYGSPRNLPRSTLLMLVSAFAGRETILRAYDEAIARGYRFYSLGDCTLLV